MLDIDPGLDSRLRTLYEHIEAQSPSDALQGFAPPGAHGRPRARARTLNLVAAVVGVAVVAAGAAVFATELAHRGAKSPAPAISPSALARDLPKPSELTSQLPAIGHTVVPITYARGSATLPTFTPKGMIFIEYACSGNGPITILSTDHQVGSGSPMCYSSGAGASVEGTIVPANPAIDGTPLTLNIDAGPSMIWEIVVSDSGSAPPLPALGSGSIPAGARIVVPLTFGVGTSQLETFAPTGPYYVMYACTGTGTIDFTSTNHSGHWVRQSCADGATLNAQVSAKPPESGPMDLTVVTAPKTLWEAMVVEGDGLPGVAANPSGFQLPAGAQVLAPLTRGTGSSLRVEADPAMTWEILIYGQNVPKL